MRKRSAARFFENLRRPRERCAKVVRCVTDKVEKLFAAYKYIGGRRLNQARRPLPTKENSRINQADSSPTLVTFHLSSTRHWCGHNAAKSALRFPSMARHFARFHPPNAPSLRLYKLYRTLLFLCRSYCLISFVQKILLPVHWVLSSRYTFLIYFRIFLCILAATAATKFHHFYESSVIVVDDAFFNFFFLPSSRYSSILPISCRKILQLR